MTYLASLLLYASVTLLGFAVILMWFSVRRLHHLLAQQTADLQRVETMLRDLERVSVRRTGWHRSQHMIVRNGGDGTSIVRAEGLRYGTDDAMKFSW